MRFEYDKSTDPPEHTQAEALQQIAIQLERIADKLERDNE